KLQEGYYSLIVVADDPTTSGMDYTPKMLQLDMTGQISGTVISDFGLCPGATVRITGSAELVELGAAPEGLYFVAMDACNGTQYQRDRRMYEAIDLGPDIIVVPAKVPITLFGVSRTYSFVIDNDGSYFYFQQGDFETIDVGKVVMERNVEVVRGLLNSTKSKVEKFGISGIEMKTELNDLDAAFAYLGLAELSLGEKSYTQCFINLRAAYVIVQDVEAVLEKTMSDLAFSPIPLSFLFVLSAFGLASIFVEKEDLKMASGLLTSLLFLGISYYVAPGWRLVDPAQLLVPSIAASCLSVGLAIVFPRVKRDIVTPFGIAFLSSLTSTFSLATRNLKRRRIRTSLVLTSIFTLVFGFTVFTSFRFQAFVAYGKPASPYPHANPPKGLMIVTPPGLASTPIPSCMVEALRNDPSVTSVAPKAESSPSCMEGRLTSDGGYSMTIRGAIGVSSEEAKMSKLDAAVISGHYLAEGESALLISERAAEQLRVSPGDKVRLTWETRTGESTVDFMVAGILDDEILEWISDLDGQPIRPYFTVEYGLRYYVSTENMVVLDWKELMELGLGSLTRINVQARSADDTVQLSVELARKWRYFVYASDGKEIKLFYYRKDPALVGSSSIPMVLVLVGLNVLACTLNAVYERRKEVVTLSLLGLNPSHISYIFLAEAILLAFIGGSTGYLFSVGMPRILLSLGGPGFLTEKTSWFWGVVAILMTAAVTVSASVIPAKKASEIATPQIPHKYKLEYIQTRKDLHKFYVHVPYVVSKLELGQFISFVRTKCWETQALRTIPEKMEFIKVLDESDQDNEVVKLVFSHSFAQEGSRAFRTENELAMVRSKGSPNYSIDLIIEIDMIYNFDSSEVIRRTTSAIRWLMLQWTASPSSDRWDFR
ncbi:MAG: ABC transporter permease, partial [Candidatus Brockarchaeota archaeon]|nr:ABC transporter permease [Candidatus Brockarchaeota archaeon]